MGDWVPLMDYAMKTGISLSTLRRHIKANKIHYRVENGRYLLNLNSQPSGPVVPGPVAPASTSAVVTAQALPTDSQQHQVPQLQARIRKMAADLQKAQEEIAELKTLIAFYEESIGRAGAPAPGPVTHRFNV